MVAGRSISTGMIIAVMVRTSAATFPISCVDVASPGPGHAQRCALVDDDAGARERARFSQKSNRWPGGRSEAVRLAHRSRWQTAAGQRENSLQLALTLQTNVKSWLHGRNNPYSVPLREQPPQRGPRLFTVERYTVLSTEY